MDAPHSATARESLLARPYEALTRFVVTYPYFVLAVALLLGGLSIYLTCTRLAYHTSRLDLINQDSEFYSLWFEYIREFGEDDDAVIVVEGPNRDRVITALDEINAFLARHTQLFRQVLHDVDLGKIRAKGLHYVSPSDLQGIDQFLTSIDPVLGGDWNRLSLVQRAGELQARLAYLRGQPESPASKATLREIEELAARLEATLAGRPWTGSPWGATPDSLATLSELSRNHLLMQDGQLGLILLRLGETDENNFVPGNEAVDTLRAMATAITARHPDIKVGFTGLPIMENDEMKASQNSMTWASIVSMGGVLCLFIAGFGGVRHAILANLVLLLGMAWSFGYVTLFVGHLNILSVSFTVTLIGIGIDYGVHFVSRYLQIRAQHVPCAEALVATGRAISPAITTGAVTTAAAFYCAGFTSFVGIAELGIVAGGGILLCAVAMLVVLPAVIVIYEGNSRNFTPPQPLAVNSWINIPLARPRTTLGLALTCTALMCIGMPKLWYDNNLLNMQADGVESVELEKRLLNECQQSSWYALSLADSRAELLERKEKFLQLASVERTEDIVTLVPEGDAERSPAIRRIGARLTELPERPPLVAVDRPEMIGQLLGALQQTLVTVAPGSPALGHLEQARVELRRLSLADCYARIARYQQQAAGDLLSRLHALASMADPEPPKFEDLPEPLVSRFVGHHGRHLLKIYGRGNIWDVHALERFVHEVRSVDPRVTGNPLQAYEATHEMRRSFEQAGLYASLIVVVVVWLDFRSVWASLLALTPLILGVGQMFGLMGWLNIPLNPANLIALPLILGIGIDYGVHIVHEYREQTGPYSMCASTAVALLVDSLTTIVGFGSMMIATHQGLVSLGRILTIGVTCCLVTSVLVLPAGLRLLSRGKGTAAPEPPDATPHGPVANARGERRRVDPAHPTAAPHAPRPAPAWGEKKSPLR
ncbi:MAG: MMPL family transporter [Pirellulales bacterium]|nr:MMPL family transporter [Pirellulales bacterium]